MFEDYIIPDNLDEHVDRLVDKAIDRHEWYGRAESDEATGDYYMLVAPCCTSKSADWRVAGEEEDNVGCVGISCKDCVLHTYVRLFEWLGLEEIITEEDRKVHEKVTCD